MVNLTRREPAQIDSARSPAAANTPIGFSSVYLRLLIRSGLMPADQLLAGSGLIREKLATREWIRWESMARVLQNLDHHLSPAAWTAELGARFGIATHGPLGFGALSAPHLESSFQFLSGFLPVRATAVTAHCVTRESRLSLEIVDRTGDEQFFGWLCPTILKTIEALIAAQLGHFPDARVIVSLAGPAANHAADLNRAFDSEIRFNTGCNAISVPGSWRHRPSALHDELVFISSRKECEQILAQRVGKSATLDRVKHSLTEHFDRCLDRRYPPSAPPDLEQMAVLLNLTPRTLIRRLRDAGTHYKTLLQDMRCHYAQQLLLDARLTVADIAERLGYREPANFGRAFKRWTGQSPAAWRRRTT